MATNYKKIETGVNVVPKSASTSDSLGDIEVLSSTNKATLHNGSSASPIVTEAHSATLTNKTIDADSNTITNIDNADIKSGANIARDKLAAATVSTVAVNDASGNLSALALTSAQVIVGNGSGIPSAVSVTGDVTISNTGVTAISAGVIVDADINASAGIVDTKLATISTAGKVSNSATTATDANTASAIVARDASGNFSAGTITASLTGSASNNVLKAGDTMTGNLIMDNEKEVRFREATGSGTNYAAIKAPATLAADYTLTLPVNDGGAGEYLQTDGSGVLSWGSPSSAGGLASVAPGSTINTNYTVVSGDNGRVLNIDCSGGPINVALPAPSSGFKLTIKDYKGQCDLNNITILRNGSEKIDNTASDDTMDIAYQAVSLVSDGTDWYRIATFSGIVPSTAPLGLFMGGSNTSNVNQNTIDYVDIETTANATDFGDLTLARWMGGACASKTRGVLGGGGTDGSNQNNTIDYVTFSTVGNATDFGDLTVARFGVSGCGSSTRGLFMGGTGGGATNEIDYITFTSLSNATDFGDLSEANVYYSAGCSSTTRGIRGGSPNAPLNIIDYVTIASVGNATDFGDLSVGRNALAGCSSSTRGLFAGGDSGSVSNVVDYITIASLGNATDFGDLSTAKYFPGACSSELRALVAGGGTTTSIGSATNSIDYFTIASLGDATDFGDLTLARSYLSGCSNAHGGL